MDTTDLSEDEVDAILGGDAPPAMAADPAAPYGRFRNGKPRKSPAKASGGSPFTASVPGPKKTASRPARSGGGSAGKPDYEQLAKNVAAIPVMALTFGGQILAQLGRKELGSALQVDGMTVGLATDKLAAQAAQLAPNDPRTARFLERFGAGGLYGDMAATMMMIGLQFAVNHGRMDPQPAIGLLHPQEIVDRASGGAAAAGGAEDAVPAG